jgi:hypothetical protein
MHVPGMQPPLIPSTHRVQSPVPPRLPFYSQAHLQRHLFLHHPANHRPHSSPLHPCTRLHHPPCLCLTTLLRITLIHRLYHPPRLRPPTLLHIVPCRCPYHLPCPHIAMLQRLAVLVPFHSIPSPIPFLHHPRLSSALLSACCLPLTTPCTCHRPQCLIHPHNRHPRPQILVPCRPCLLTPQ